MDNESEPLRKTAAITLGGDLSTFSIEELTARITACESEIERLRVIIAEKQKSQAAAENFFRN